jgi:hypothetical protein
MSGLTNVACRLPCARHEEDKLFLSFIGEFLFVPGFTVAHAMVVRHSASRGWHQTFYIIYHQPEENSSMRFRLSR